MTLEKWKASCVWIAGRSRWRLSWHQMRCMTCWRRESNLTSPLSASLPSPPPPSRILHVDHHVYWPLTYILSCFVNLVPLTLFFPQDLNFLHCSCTICRIFQECNQHEQQGLAVFQQLQVLLESNCPCVIIWMCGDILCGKILLLSTTVCRNLCCQWQD